MATSTPWGPSQYSTKIAPGIVRYGTAGHGGIHVSTKLNASMPEHLCNPSGWYEEDEQWVKVAVAFPQHFDKDRQVTTHTGEVKTVNDYQIAKDTLKNWEPEAYEKHFGVVLQPGESYIKDQQAFTEQHKNDWIAVSAQFVKGDRSRVQVIASPGGSYTPGRAEKTFVVPAAEYDQRDQFGFVIDPARHPEVEGNA